LPDIPVGVNGAVLRYTGFPENFIKTNPQFSTATMQSNPGNTNYHSLQTQVTLRPTAGVDLQASYTWSKLLGTAGTYTNPVDRNSDYTLQVGDRRHDFRTSGSFALPIGPNQVFLRNTSGVLARILERWEMSWVLNVGSGAPANIVAATMLYANGVPDLVGPFDISAANVQWKDGQIAGNYFGGAYTKVRDPQCSTIAANLRSLCTLNAVADSSGQIVLRNPSPGTRGNLGQNVIEMPGLRTIDASVSKAFRVDERRNVRLRIDATNIFNHPQVENPNMDINSTELTFGNISTKTGQRQFQAQLRLEF
jgi:hypothetical protein